MHWDQLATAKLVDLGLTWEAARIAVGEIAEQRQIADRLGYLRGFTNGYEASEQKWGKIEEELDDKNKGLRQRFEAFKHNLAQNKLFQPEYYI